jgi:integrase
MHAKIHFTDTTIRKLKAPDQGRNIYRASNKANLFLRVMPTGKKTFYVQKKVNGRTRRANLGTWPELTAKAAIASATERLATLQGHVDPLKRERQLNTVTTVADLWERFITHCEGYLSSGSIACYRSHFKNLAEIKDYRLGALDHGRIQQLADKIGRDRPRASNRAIKMLALMIDSAKKWLILPADYPNPARNIRKFPEPTRERYLNKDELGRLFESLAAEEDERWRHLFLLCLFTGARRGNVQAMRWDQIDTTLRVWSIRNDDRAGTSTKTGHDIILPLCERAMGILALRAPYRDGSPWVFPSARSSKSGHIANPFKPWARIIKRAGLKNVRIHDLRRTLGVWMVQNGTPLKVIQEQLGHRDINSTMVYAHTAGLDQVRKANTEITQKMIDTAQ